MPATTPPVSPQLVFTGNGREYFRIWIVNLCLSLCTLGIYSAWAKVRRLQYFYRNTQLAGACFDFHGEAKTIFKGRLCAVLLLALYNYAFGFSKTFAICVVVFLLLALPWMMRGALRFRLRNSSYRGLRFDFDGSLRDAYLTYWPLLFLFFAPPLIIALDWPEAWLVIPGLGYLAWPWIHGRLRAYQHRHLCYGQLHSQYHLRAGSFFQPYLFAVLLGLAAILVGGIITGLLLAGSRSLASNQAVQVVLSVLVALFFVYLIYLFSLPYLEARLFNMVWNQTTLPQIRIACDLPVLAWMRLQCINTLLTLLTLGLYRPFAVVAVWRFRLRHSHLLYSSMPQTGAPHLQGASSASGDGTADFLNIDLSW